VQTFDRTKLPLEAKIGRYWYKQGSSYNIFDKYGTPLFQYNWDYIYEVLFGLLELSNYANHPQKVFGFVVCYNGKLRFQKLDFRIISEYYLGTLTDEDGTLLYNNELVQNPVSLYVKEYVKREKATDYLVIVSHHKNFLLHSKVFLHLKDGVLRQVETFIIKKIKK